jgi:hypothetical protein
LRGLFDSQPGETRQRDKPSDFRVIICQPFQGCVKREQIRASMQSNDLQGIE